MSKALGQQVVVENVTGAGGTLGSARVAKAAPDGYHARHLGLRHACRGRAALRQSALPRARFRVGRPRQHDAGRDRGQARFAAQYAAGAGRLPARQREDRHRGGRRRRLGLASRLFGVPFADRHQADRGVVSRHAAGDPGCAGGQRGFSAATRSSTSSSTRRPGRSRPTRSPARSARRCCPNVPTTTEAGLPDFKLTVWYRPLRAQGHAGADRGEAQPGAGGAPWTIRSWSSGLPISDTTSRRRNSVHRPPSTSSCARRSISGRRVLGSMKPANSP